MGLLDRFRKKNDEASRIARLLQTGRIVEGRVIDATDDDEGYVKQIFYVYDVAGVQYESSQPLDSAQRLTKLKYAPGAQIIIRYDPRQPGNSTVV